MMNGNITKEIMSSMYDKSDVNRKTNCAVQALKEIAVQVKKRDWNFSIDPCSNHTIWITPTSNAWPAYNNSVNCNCSSGVCHVILL